MERISVKNFRSIEDSGEIEICPLTVVVGKNSAGKSSFVRLFPLLKQTIERRISDTLLWYGDYVDFGDYQHTVSRKAKDQPIEIAFTIITYERLYGRYTLRMDNRQFPVRVNLFIRETYIEKVCLEILGQKVILEIDENGLTRTSVNGDYRPFEKKKLISYRESGSIIPMLYENVKSEEENYLVRYNAKDIVKYCINYIYEGLDEGIYNKYPFYDEIDIGMGSEEDILAALKKINPSKFKKFNITHKRFIKINNLLVASKISSLIERVNQAVSIDMKQTSYLKPIRAMVNRYYRVQGISIDELDADGSNLPMILKNMNVLELSEFEKWSKEKFGVVFSVNSTEGHISLIIKNDVDGDIITNVADTGYGYSQMLPIVMLLWKTHMKKSNIQYQIGQTIVIEQPELHLHPAYQAKMIEVFINVISEAERNGINIKIIIETHSETMINKIGTLISEKKIAENKVNILIFSKAEEHTIIESKRFNEEGLLKGWPIGFFSAEEE